MPTLRATAVALLAGNLALALVARSARADDVKEEVAFSHKGELGALFQLGMGYRVLFPYNSEYCGQMEKVCTGREPLFSELGISYGVSHSVELLVDLRLGIEQDFSTPTSGGGPHDVAVAPGAKVYIDDSGSAKFFSTLQVAFDFTDYSKVSTATRTDVALKNVNGLQWDFQKNFGVYVHFGETIGFVRWLRFEVEGGVGLQGRYP